MPGWSALSGGKTAGYFSQIEFWFLIAHDDRISFGMVPECRAQAAQLTPWIGFVALRAGQPEAAFWSLGTDLVAGRLVVRAADAAAFEAQVRQALAARDLELTHVHEVRQITDHDGPELRTVAADAQAQTPLLFGRLCDARQARPAQIEEITRPALRARANLWALLDGVAWPGLPDVLAQSGDEHVCLYTSTDPGTLASAPWLVRLAPGAVMAEAIDRQPCDTHIGIFFESTAPIMALRQHLRHFTMAHVPDGAAPVYFRFYDPRVAMDMASALSVETLARFMALMEVLYVPLSPTTVLPDYAAMALPVTPFDTERRCHGRIARISLRHRPAPHTRGAFGISSAEFLRFQQIQRKKARRGLARKLSVEFPGRDWADYRSASEKALHMGRQHGLKSVKQVSVLARCMMMQGVDFTNQFPAAAAILARRDLYPWQKKNALIKWLVAQPLQSEVAHV